MGDDTKKKVSPIIQWSSMAYPTRHKTWGIKGANGIAPFAQEPERVLNSA